MAGEWIKMEVSLPDKPEVLRVARMLGIDKDGVIGKLVRLWAWFDRNSVDGVVDGVVGKDIDDICYQSGFADALVSVGWLFIDTSAERVEIPRFDRHNGESAKKRALKNERQAKWRASNATAASTEASTEASTQESQKASTREEKRRDIDIGAQAPQTPRGSRLDPDWSLPDDWRTWAKAERPDLDPSEVADTFRDYWVSVAGQKGRKADWQATWRNWVRSQKVSLRKPVSDPYGLEKAL